MVENTAPQLALSAGPPISHAQVGGARTTRILAGYFQQNETEAYLNSRGTLVDGAGGAPLELRCADARAHVAGLSPRTEPSFELLADDAYLVELRAEPTFVEHVVSGGAEFATIELARLVACQPSVDWSHVAGLASNVPKVGDDEGLLRFCLPLQRTASAPIGRISLNGAMNTFDVVVANPDVRICGPVQGEQPGGRGLFGFAIGAGLLQMNVVAFNGRYMLNNGYHRAVALLAAGHKRIPVILVQAPAIDATPTVRNGMFNPRLIFGLTPPRVEDFLGAAAVDVSTGRQQFLFSIHAEIHRVPAA